MHYYLEQLGVDPDGYYLQEDPAVTKHHPEMQEEINKYGFPACETWDLGNLSTAWLYEHLRLFLDEGGEIVDLKDLNFHKVTIPRLVTSRDPNAGKVIDGKYHHYYEEKETECTLEEAIKICCLYLSSYLKYIDDQEAINDELQLNECRQQAFKIYSIILPYMWW